MLLFKKRHLNVPYKQRWRNKRNLISSSVVAFSCLLSSQYQDPFQSVILRIRWPKYQSFSLTISPSNEYSGLISIRINWFDLLAVQGKLKSLLQHHDLKASVLQSPDFVWSNSHIHTWLLENPVLTIWTFPSKVMSLPFDILCRFVIAYFQGASVLISWLQSPSAVILESKKIKSTTISTVYPSVCHEVMRPISWSSFFNVEF